MKRITFTVVAMMLLSGIMYGQGVGINASGNSPNTNAMLDVSSSSMGMLIPRLTNAEIATLGASLGSQEKGMIVFNSEDLKLEYWEGSKWKTMVTKPSSSGSSSDGSSFCSEGVSDYDGIRYKTVKIGNQCWMAENLRSNHYADGTTITEVYNYNNDYGTGLTYGYLYTWYAVMNGEASSNENPSGVQGVCPDGWHVPSDVEWKELEMTIGMTSTESNTIGFRGSHSEGCKLKETEDAFLWTDHTYRGTNSSGFTALPAGHFFDSSFSLLEEFTYFSSSTQENTFSHWIRGLSYSSDGIYRTNYQMYHACSVRCVQD